MDGQDSEGQHQDQEVLGCLPTADRAPRAGLGNRHVLAGARRLCCRVAIPREALHDLEERLLLFFTGYSRSASEILSDQKKRSESNDVSMLESLRFTDKLGRRIKEALELGDTPAFADLMHEHWEYKRVRSAGMTNPQIDHWYELGRANGARGGKLVGAGAGGFLLFYAEDPSRLRAAMASASLPEVRFRFDHDGSVVLVRD